MRNPEAKIPLIGKLSCSLVNVSEHIDIVSGTLTHRAYGIDSTDEWFQCRYGLNEKYRSHLDDGNLRFVGFDKSEGVRVFELKHHPFFVASLFLPQVSSRSDRPHPLILALINAAVKLKRSA